MNWFKTSAVVLGVLGLSAANAMASSASDSGGAAVNLVSQTTTGTAASQSASLIAGSFSPGGGGGGGTGIGVTMNNVNDPREAKGRIQYFNLREMQGRSAGGKALRFNMWLNGAYTGIKKTDAGGEFEGGVANVVGGVDYKLTKNFLIGIAGGYENVDIDTTFNNGTFDGNGYTIAGYMGYAKQLSGGPVLAWDFSGGYTAVDYDVSRTVAGITGSFDADRWFLSSNLTATFRAKNKKLRMSPKIGLLYLEESQDSYTESNGTPVGSALIALGRFTGGAEVGYQLNVGKPMLRSIEPFAKAYVEWDWEHEKGVDLGGGRTSAADDYGFVAGGGVNLNFNDRLSGRVEGSANALGRDELDIWTVSGKINYRF